MTLFKVYPAEEVQIGRAYDAWLIREKFAEHIRAGDAGRLTLQKHEKPDIVKRLLMEGSHHAGIRIRSRWEANGEGEPKHLWWKRVGV